MLITGFVNASKFTNMWSERLLALFRRSVGNKEAVDAERFLASGFMAQVLREFRKRDVPDPVSITRQKVLELGVNIRCGQKHVAGNVRGGGFVIWKAEQEALRTEKFSKDEYHQWLSNKATEYACLHADTKKMYSDRAKRAKEGVEALPKVPFDFGIHKTIVQDFGDEEVPFTSSAFKEEIRRFCKTPDDKPLPGLYNFGPRLREKQDPGMVVMDKGSISAKEVFDGSIPCGMAHPGFCAYDHSDVLLRSLDIQKQLHKYFRDTVGSLGISGTFWHLLVSGEVFEFRLWVCTGYCRGSPKIFMLTSCVFDAENNIISVDDTADVCQGEIYEYLVDQSFLARLMTHPDGGIITRVTACAAPLDKEKIHWSACAVYLDSEWATIIGAESVQVYPAVQERKCRFSSTREFKALKAGLKDMCPASRGGLRPRLPIAKVALVKKLFLGWC